MLPYVVASIETGVPWPTQDTTISFRGHELNLLAETSTLTPAVVMKLIPPLTEDEGIRLVKQFLTALAWVHRQPVRELMTSPQGALVRVGKPPQTSTTTTTFYEDYLPVPDDPHARFALALYRHALGVNDVGYKCLGYFRIMQLPHPGNTLEAWLEETVPRLADYEATQRLPGLEADAAAAGRTVGQYLYGLVRSAMAHGKPDDPVNPDERADIRRLHQHEPIIRALAEFVVETELGVPSARNWRLTKRRAAEQ